MLQVRTNNLSETSPSITLIFFLLFWHIKEDVTNDYQLRIKLNSYDFKLIFQNKIKFDEFSFKKSYFNWFQKTVNFKSSLFLMDWKLFFY